MVWHIIVIRTWCFHGNCILRNIFGNIMLGIYRQFYQNQMINCINLFMELNPQCVFISVKVKYDFSWLSWGVSWRQPIEQDMTSEIVLPPQAPQHLHARHEELHVQCGFHEDTAARKPLETRKWLWWSSRSVHWEQTPLGFPGDFSLKSEYQRRF